MVKAVGYVRVSTEEQVKEGVSLEAQEQKIQAYRQLTGLELLEVIRDEGISGAKPLEHRPGGRKLLQVVGKGKVKNVVALKLDRLFRDAGDALQLTKEWDKAGIALHLIDLGGQTLNTASAVGRFFLTMLAGMAELERNLIAERTATALRYKKATKKVYAPVPLGFDKEGDKLQENGTELGIVRLIREAREKGKSFHQIAKELNMAGIPTKKGRKWYASTVRYIAQNPLYSVVGK
ncbi:MAG: recombinase family protein [Candidatus Methanomethyliaceae archaeon]